MTMRSRIRQAQIRALLEMTLDGVTLDQWEDRWCFLTDAERERFILEETAPFATVAADLQERCVLAAHRALALEALEALAVDEARQLEDILARVTAVREVQAAQHDILRGLP